jgi:DNA repair protein RadC
MKQEMLPGMPPVDYEHVLAIDQAVRRRKRTVVPLAPAGEIFATAPHTVPEASPIERAVQPEAATPPATALPERRRSSSRRKDELHPLHEALAPYLNFPKLRQLAAQGEDLTQAYIGTGEMPAEVLAVLDALRLLLRPVHREQVKSPRDIAAVFMLEMGHLDQEQLRVACLNTKNRLQKIHLVYQGSLSSSLIRVGEIYKEPLRLNSAAIIVAHNHPSGEPNPSPEDVLVTQEIVQAGKLLDVECLDHLVIGQGKWMSMREKELGW